MFYKNNYLNFILFLLKGKRCRGGSMNVIFLLTSSRWFFGDVDDLTASYASTKELLEKVENSLAGFVIFSYHINYQKAYDEKKARRRSMPMLLEGIKRWQSRNNHSKKGNHLVWIYPFIFLGIFSCWKEANEVKLWNWIKFHWQWTTSNHISYTSWPHTLYGYKDENVGKKVEEKAEEK